VARLSEGRISLRPGTLYGALDRLVDAGLVSVDREETVDGRLRRYYRLSEQGGGLLAAENERMRRNVEVASARLRTWARPGATRLREGLA
jgi:DNA-binding PadR family transcriptional regulator